MKHNLFLLAFAAVTGTLSATSEIPGVELVREWKIFYSKDLTKEIASTLRYEDKELILNNGTKILPVRMKHTPLIDLSRGKPYKVGEDKAALAGAIYAEKPCTVYIGMGADWWIDAFCNGQYFGGTNSTGNENWPPSATDHIFKVSLRAGRNDLVLFVQPGTGCWKLALNFLREYSDPDVPSRQLPAPGIAYGPFLTNPGRSSVTITYLLNGRQPLELEYRRAGETSWTKTGILRGGQLIDEVPYMQFQLKGLIPGSTYEYRALIRQPSEYKTAVADKIRTFRTFTDKPERLSFYLMGDTQDTTKRENLLRLKRIQEGCPEVQKADFFLHVGDLHGVIANFRGDVFDSLLKLIPAETYIISARGNHEFEGPEAQQWLDYFNFRDHKSYGILRVGEVCILVLDSGHHLPPDSTNCHQIYAGLNDLDTILEEQKVWLQKVVNTPEFQTAKFRIVMAHVAPHGHNSDSIDDTYMVARLKKMTESLFKGNPAPYPIDLWVAGHTHVYRKAKPDPDWNFPVMIVSGGAHNAMKRPGMAFLFEADPGILTVTTLDWNGAVLEKLILKK